MLVSEELNMGIIELFLRKNKVSIIDENIIVERNFMSKLCKVSFFL